MTSSTGLRYTHHLRRFEYTYQLKTFSPLVALWFLTGVLGTRLLLMAAGSDGGQRRLDGTNHEEPDPQRGFVASLGRSFGSAQAFLLKQRPPTPSHRG